MNFCRSAIVAGLKNDQPEEGQAGHGNHHLSVEVAVSFALTLRFMA
jgi:hypothetical protein